METRYRIAWRSRKPDDNSWMWLRDFYERVREFASERAAWDVWTYHASSHLGSEYRIIPSDASGEFALPGEEEPPVHKCEHGNEWDDCVECSNSTTASTPEPPPVDLDHLSGLHAQSTQGEWQRGDEITKFGIDAGYIGIPEGEGNRRTINLLGLITSHDDAAWVTESHRQFPALIARMKWLESEVARMKGEK